MHKEQLYEDEYLVKKEQLNKKEYSLNNEKLNKKEYLVNKEKLYKILLRDVILNKEWHGRNMIPDQHSTLFSAGSDCDFLWQGCIFPYRDEHFGWRLDQIAKQMGKVWDF